MFLVIYNVMYIIIKHGLHAARAVLFDVRFRVRGTVTPTLSFAEFSSEKCRHGHVVTCPGRLRQGEN